MTLPLQPLQQMNRLMRLSPQNQATRLSRAINNFSGYPAIPLARVKIFQAKIETLFQHVSSLKKCVIVENESKTE